MRENKNKVVSQEELCELKEQFEIAKEDIKLLRAFCRAMWLSLEKSALIRNKFLPSDIHWINEMLYDKANPDTIHEKCLKIEE